MQGRKKKYCDKDRRRGINAHVDSPDDRFCRNTYYAYRTGLDAVITNDIGGNMRILYKLKLFKEEKGMGTIEIVIIIAILAALALLFRQQIMKLFNMILDKLQQDVSKAADL